MELLSLQYFVEIVKLGSISETARKNHISQPSLSQTMRRLEREVGNKLFEKNGRGIRLTPFGRNFYTHISPALQEISEAVSLANSSNVAGHIVIGSYMPLSPILPYIKEFSAAYPDINFSFIRITDMSFINPKIIDALLCYEYSDSFNFQDRYYISSIYSSFIAPIDKIQKSKSKPVNIQDLREHDFVSLEWDGNKIEGVFDEFFRHDIVPRIRYRTNSALFKEEILEAGLAFGFTNSMISSQFRNTGNYAEIPHPIRDRTIKLFMCWPLSEPESPAVNEFRKYMISKLSHDYDTDGIS